MNTNCLLINRSPLVATIYLYPDVELNRHLMRDREAFVLFFFMNYETASTIGAKLGMIRRNYPKLVFRAAVDRPRLFETLRHEYPQVVFAHQNALADDRIYRPMPHVKPLYDAVYTASTTAGKRHYLADEIPSWLWITYMPTADGMDRFHQIRAKLRNVRIPQWAGGRYWYWDSQQIAHCLNEAPVGLCLTAHEGGMWAASEYHLAGLPVVMTCDGVGGMHSVLLPEFTQVVDPEPLAIATATRELAARNFPRQQIREAEQLLLKPHRQRLQGAMQELFDAAGVKRDIVAEWPRLFFDKFFHWGESPLVWA